MAAITSMMAVSLWILQLFVWYVEMSRDLLYEKGPRLALMLAFNACGPEMNLQLSATSMRHATKHVSAIV
jgi:hypothetical protein